MNQKTGEIYTMQSFKKHLQHWNLMPDGDPIFTHSSDLLPVIYQDQKAMLKIAKRKYCLRQKGYLILATAK